MKLRRTIFATWLALSLSLPLSAAQVTKQNADRLQRKIDEITENGSRNPVAPKKTAVTQDEVNSYLAYNARDKIPPGLTQPEITLFGNGRLGGRILVDIDEFKRHRNSQGFIDPFNYISGKVPVTARGVLRAREGKGQFQLESAEISGFPVPKPILQELVSFFSRTPEHPEGFKIDAPFDLPAKIREVVFQNGEAVIVQ
jgi:hypothetical protein